MDLLLRSQLPALRVHGRAMHRSTRVRCREVTSCFALSERRAPSLDSPLSESISLVRSPSSLAEN